MNVIHRHNEARHIVRSRQVTRQPRCLVESLTISSWEISRFTPSFLAHFAGRPAVKAAVTALAVFMALYLAVGFGLFGFNWRSGLIWPYLLGGLFLRALLITVAGFAAVALYIYRLRLRALAASDAKIRDLENDLAVCREQVRDMRASAETARKSAESRVAAAEEAARVAREARERAESRLADAEARGRGAAQNTNPSGEDKRFTEARRVFARLYHPDNVKTGGLDKVIRAEIFKEYWLELENIDKTHKK